MSVFPPAVIPSPQSIADKLIHALQHGDVAIVLTRKKLNALIHMVETSWKSDVEFELLQELKNLRDQSA